MRPVALTGRRIDTPDDAPAQEKACVPDETFSVFLRRGPGGRPTFSTTVDKPVPPTSPLTPIFASLPKVLRLCRQALQVPPYTNLSPFYGTPKLLPSNGVQLTDDVGIRTYVTARAHGPSRGSSRIDEDQLQIGPSHGCVDCNDRSGPGLECLFRAYQRARSWHAAAKADTSLCRFFTLICSDATRNAYHAFRVSITTGSERLRTSDDYLNFAALAGRRGRVGGRKLRRRGLHEDISIR